MRFWLTYEDVLTASTSSPAYNVTWEVDIHYMRPWDSDFLKPDLIHIPIIQNYLVVTYQS